MRISIVIPALNEARVLGDSLAALPREPGLEILVADGGSADGTAAIAERHGARVVTTARGRGRQMNAGAASATGETLLFLHADTRLPADAYDWVRRVLDDARIAGGAFHLSIAGEGWFYAFTARNANLRSKFLGSPYGDQAFFVRRRLFETIGGFRDLPYCEDLDLIRRLRRHGRVVLAPAAVSTSARRWEQHGRTWVTVRNGLLFFRYWMGLLKETGERPFPGRSGRGTMAG